MNNSNRCDTHIVYKEIPTYKYEVVKPFQCQTGIKVSPSHSIPFATLAEDGMIHIEKGYRWDGPSGPAIDTKDFIRPSLVHDALFQLFRETTLDPSAYRYQADRLLQRMCLADGMSWIRACWVFTSLRWFGRPASLPSKRREAKQAP